MNVSKSDRRYGEALAEILKRGVTDDAGGVLVPCDPTVDRDVHVLVHEFHPSELVSRGKDKDEGWICRNFQPEPETPEYFAKMAYEAVEWKPNGAYFTPVAIRCAKLAVEHDGDPYLPSGSFPEVRSDTLAKAAEAGYIRRRRATPKSRWKYSKRDVHERWPEKFSG